jgi:uncharacterized protein (UPF0332 family)
VEDVIVKTHSGAKNKFHLLFIKQRIISETTGKLIDYLFGLRSDADYGDFTTYSREDVEPLLDETNTAILEIRKWLESQLNKGK